MRLIDADKLKRHYAWWPEDERRVLDEIVDMQPTADFSGFWIPVDELLPEPFASVLLYLPEDRPLPPVHEGYYVAEGGFRSVLFGRCEPTHWMPMPEYPKGDAE